VALCHLLAMANPAADGRYLMVTTSLAWRAVAEVLRAALPTARIPSDVEAGGGVQYPQALVSLQRAHDLGVNFTPIETSLRDCALSLYARGYLSAVIPPAADPRQPPAAAVPAV